jgi:hypothetical protein
MPHAIRDKANQYHIVAGERQETPLCSVIIWKHLWFSLSLAIQVPSPRQIFARPGERVK